ncbi:MAG: hypothetical protein A2240_00910 [Candidatus Jacksonbacteria bacterium RIFOXYA2_FULL_43_12]|nr:MAG: hypothetical protein A2240_00910 [Candidatus Jacksonbacteria bacterium RIFOXYA2_FULL_43_12]
MNLKGIFKIISPVIITVGLAMVGCALAAYLFKEDARPLLAGAFGALVFGVAVYFITRKAGISNLGIEEGCVVVTLSWIIACIFGALPFYVLDLIEHAHSVSITKAIFETVSGFTTTGATIYKNVESLPKSLLLWRSLTQWLGGMGIVVLAIAILPKLGFGGRQAFKMESPGPVKTEKLVPRISETGKILYTVYLGMTAIQIIFLLMAGVSFYDAVIHSFSTVATGGFSNYNNSVAGLGNIYAEYIIAVFMWLAGVNFGLIYVMLWRRQLKKFFRNVEFKVYAVITVVAVVLISGSLFFSHYHNWALGRVIRYVVFQVPSVLTTTCFTTADYSRWPVFAVAVLLLLMFIGGSTGSTSGSIKVLRHIISYKLIKHEILKIIRPNLVTTVKVGSQAIEHKVVVSVLAFILIYVATVVVGGVVLTLFDLDLVTALTASIASLGNFGPGLGAVGPASNYVALHPVALWILMFEMIIGRLEIYTVFALFNVALWRRRI